MSTQSHIEEDVQNENDQQENSTDSKRIEQFERSLNPQIYEYDDIRISVSGDFIILETTDSVSSPYGYTIWAVSHEGDSTEVWYLEDDYEL